MSRYNLSSAVAVVDANSTGVVSSDLARASWHAAVPISTTANTPRPLRRHMMKSLMAAAEVQREGPSVTYHIQGMELASRPLRMSVSIGEFPMPVSTPAPTVTQPRAVAWREPLIRTVAIVALVYGSYWILWRWTNTINTNAIVPSVILLIAETWAYLSMCFFVLLTWRLTNREPGPPPAGRTLDVFITCYDEPLEVLRRTAIGARGICYP